jgi:glyoxylase-like metal-dependent hydrolase (beta-lactamase superfamily II)
MEWQIGEARIRTIVEQSVDDLATLVTKAKPEAVRAISWLRPHFATEEGELLGLVQCFVIELHGKTLVVDTCVGDGKDLPVSENWHKQHFGLLDRFAEAGVDPTKVDFVLCTHMHLDHVGLNTYWDGEAWQPTFPNARYLFARAEYDHWAAENAKPVEPPAADDRPYDVMMRLFHQTQVNIEAESIGPIVAAGLADIVETPCEPIPGIRLVPTPGHTPGHVSVELESAGEKALITGDCFHHPCQIAHADWATVADTDRQVSTATRQQLLEDLVNTRILVLGTHFAAPTGGYIVAEGGTYRLEIQDD